MKQALKTIGLIGGMSWESTTEYYRVINNFIKEQLGGLSSAKLILISLDFNEIANLQTTNNWEGAAQILIDAAKKLELAGAECVLICTNTMHKLADQIQSSIEGPLIHIADATGAEICKSGFRKVGLLGTKFTMEENFYSSHLSDNFRLKTLTPEFDERAELNLIIFNELCRGIISAESRKKVISIISNLEQKGAEAVILGCTELELLIKSSDVKIKLFDTARIHAEAAARWSLS